MRVAGLADGLKHAVLAAGPDTGELTDITNDSRRTGAGALYAALPGDHFDGHDYIQEAIARGARAILCSRLPSEPSPEVAWFLASDPRMALSELSDRFFGSPSRDVEVIGVTGTDGKTSTTYFIHQLLGALGAQSAFLSTAAMQIGTNEEPNRLHQSTPEAPEVHRTLRSMQEAGARYVVLESTSHGLSRKSCRLAHVHYRCGVFTNLSHEHLEYHGSFERYRSDKANLFRALDARCYADAPQDTDTAPNTDGLAGVRPRSPAAMGGRERFGIVNRFGVVNADDEHAAYIAGQCASPVLTYSIDRPASVRATDIVLRPTGSSFVLQAAGEVVSCSIPVPGRFNVLNALAAVAVAGALLGFDSAGTARALAALRPVKGRMSVVASDPFSVVVDYAHTPGSFESILPFFREQTPGRLIVVFGSAGERDVAKRPIQGRIADRYADAIVLADEDPRGEDRLAILREIAAGAPTRREGEDIFLIPDRRSAIRHALHIARPGDTVLLLGKGHETTIIGAQETVAWDEITVVQEEIGAL